MIDTQVRREAPPRVKTGIYEHYSNSGLLETTSVGSVINRPFERPEQHVQMSVSLATPEPAIAGNEELVIISQIPGSQLEIHAQATHKQVLTISDSHGSEKHIPLSDFPHVLIAFHEGSFLLKPLDGEFKADQTSLGQFAESGVQFTDENGQPVIARPNILLVDTSKSRLNKNPSGNIPQLVAYIIGYPEIDYVTKKTIDYVTKEPITYEAYTPPIIQITKEALPAQPHTATPAPTLETWRPTPFKDTLSELDIRRRCTTALETILPTFQSTEETLAVNHNSLTLDLSLQEARALFGAPDGKHSKAAGLLSGTIIPERERVMALTQTDQTKEHKMLIPSALTADGYRSSQGIVEITSSGRESIVDFELHRHDSKVTVTFSSDQPRDLTTMLELASRGTEVDRSTRKKVK